MPLTDGQRQFQIELHGIVLAYLKGWRAFYAGDEQPPAQSGTVYTGWVECSRHSREYPFDDEGDMEMMGQDYAESYANDLLHEEADTQSDTPSLDVDGWWSRAGF